MSLLLSAAERQAAQQQAVGAPPPGADPEQKAAAEDSYWRAICAWACSADAGETITKQASTAVPVIGLLDEAKIAEWEAALAARGFVTARVGRLLTVSLP